MTDSDATAPFCCEKEWTEDMKKAPKVKYFRSLIICTITSLLSLLLYYKVTICQ